MRIPFGEFTLDRAARRLFRDGRPVHLEPKALELLELLVARRPGAVGKGEIHETLWPGTFVSESSLTGLVAQLRKALGDDRHAERFLRTVHGFGYAFCGEVPSPAAREAPARLVWEDEVLALAPGPNLIGRAEEATARIEAPGVSRRHARIVIAGGEATLEDLGSKNGTFLNERRLEGPARLRDGDRLRLGRHLLVFRRADPGTATWTESPPPGGSS